MTLRCIFRNQTMTHPCLLNPRFTFRLLRNPRGPRKNIHHSFNQNTTNRRTITRLPRRHVRHISTILLISLFRHSTQRQSRNLTTQGPIPQVSQRRFNPITQATSRRLPHQIFRATSRISLVHAPHSKYNRGLFSNFNQTRFIRQHQRSSTLTLLRLHFRVTHHRRIFMPLMSTNRLLLMFRSMVPIKHKRRLHTKFTHLRVRPQRQIMRATLRTIRNKMKISINLRINIHRHVLITRNRRQPRPRPNFKINIRRHMTSRRLHPLICPRRLLLRSCTTRTMNSHQHQHVLRVNSVLITTQLMCPLRAIRHRVRHLIILRRNLIRQQRRSMNPTTIISKNRRRSIVTTNITTSSHHARMTTSAIHQRRFTLRKMLRVTRFTFIRDGY